MTDFKILVRQGGKSDFFCEFNRFGPFHNNCKPCDRSGNPDEKWRQISNLVVVALELGLRALPPAAGAEVLPLVGVVAAVVGEVAQPLLRHAPAVLAPAGEEQEGKCQMDLWQKELSTISRWW